MTASAFAGMRGSCAVFAQHGRCGIGYRVSSAAEQRESQHTGQ
jgi:hypothetical protein